MTFEVALKKIKTSFENVDAAKLADMAVQVTLTDEDCGGTLYFKAENGTVDVQGYDYRDNDAVIDIERKTLIDLLAGKLNLDDAIAKGKATVKGNFEKLETLKAAIPVYVAPAKKTAAKAPAKKTAAKPAAKAPAKKVAAKTETKTVAKAETKTEVKPAAKATAKTTAKKTTAAKKSTVK